MTAVTGSALLVDRDKIVAIDQSAHRDRLAVGGFADLEELNMRHGVRGRTDPRNLPHDAPVFKAPSNQFLGPSLACHARKASSETAGPQSDRERAAHDRLTVAQVARNINLLRTLPSVAAFSWRCRFKVSPPPAPPSLCPPGAETANTIAGAEHMPVSSI